MSKPPSADEPEATEPAPAAEEPTPARSMIRREREGGDHEKLLEFLTRELSQAGTRQAMKVELRCTSDRYRNEAIEAFTREADPHLFGKLTHTEAMVGKLIELMEDATDANNEASVFEVKLRRYDSSSAVRTFRMLPRRRQNDDRDMLLPHETPTGTGLLAQTMRHNEILMRQQDASNKNMFAMQETLMKMANNMMGDLREENVTLRRERADHLRQLEDRSIQESESDLAFEKQKAEDVRKDKIVDKITLLMPVLVQAIALRMTKGKPGDGKGETAKSGPRVLGPLEEVLLKFMRSMTDPQIAAVQSVLGLEQRLVLGTIVDAAEAGGSPLLAGMVGDFIGSMQPPQLAQLIQHLTPEQRVLLVEAMKLARATPQGTPREDDLARDGTGTKT